MWFTLVLVGYFLLAVVFVLDKFILTKTVTEPLVYTFYSTIFMFGALLAWPFGVELLEGVDWVWGVGSGVAFGLGLWTMFIAVKGSEASHVNPFIGAVVTIVTYLLSARLLGEQMTATQTVGIFVLATASLFLSRETTKLGTGWRRVYAFAIASGLCFAVSHVAAKYIYDSYSFLTGFVWTRAATGLVGLALLASPAVCRSFSHRSRAQTARLERRQAVGLIASDKLLGIIAVVFIQYAIARGSVTVVSALSGAQYAFLFIIIMLLTKFWPHILREYFTKRELTLQIVALAFLVLGSALAVGS